MPKLRLYYSPGACSLAPHLVLEQAGLDYELVRVDFAAGEQRSEDYLKLNPKGRVPVLCDGDAVITENPAILRYITRLAPERELWPSEPLAEARCAEWLAFLSSGLHPAYAHIRRPERYASGEEARRDVVETGKAAARALWEMAEAKLAGAGDLHAAGAALSVADFYLLVFWNWGRGSVLGYDMPGDFPAWTALARRLTELPAVRAVLEREGLSLPA
ncbi:glutathione S-transferase family protein [Aurantimonas sp. VKM B-3413]|uniref:glutathione S-transferase family protein n=1 Tax=Aurantimonas sp. VKM B-3413 TaxID=2779401 RepID=UPI001E44FB36|nr:glutathione S-transferase N-terminal domain-containing protein [Aurantimonas sp. VKM B-3413]MCB8836016.1 glutathione S-transferase N-terminal domain-containing protein [Aurantimonas sp. VKM B-3413]